MIDKKNQEDIRLLQQIELYIHLAGSSFCRLYDKQSQLIDKLAREVYQGRVGQIQNLDDAFKNALQSRIEEQMK